MNQGMFRSIKVVADEYESAGKKVIAVNGAQSTFRDVPVAQLNAYGRRKFENMIVMEHAHEPIKIIYKV